MKNTIRFAVSILLVFAFFFGSLPNVSACGPFIISPIFSLRSHADFPLTEFMSGESGIVPDTFGSVSLIVFYRQLNDLTLSNEEQNEVVRAMGNRIYYRPGVGEITYESGEPKFPDYLENWLAARADLTGQKRDIETEKRVEDGYGYFSNCLPDAFNNATKTLRARVAKFGKNEDVKEWLKGQDAVFSNCSEAAGVPEPLGENSPEWLRRDRAYQIAAAQFYVGSLEAARESFDKIAADQDSIWKPTARFVAARTFIRQASFTDINKEDFLQKASDRLEQMLKDDSMSEFHKSAYRLLGLVKYRMIPRQRQEELAGLLAQPAANTNIYNDLIDFTWLLEKSLADAESKGSEFEMAEAAKENREYNYDYRFKLRDLPADPNRDDLTDWLFAYQAADGFEHSYDKWKATGKLAWFVAAITKTAANAGQLAEILNEADKVKQDSPAFTTIRYHQIRLLIESGKRDEARAKLNQFIGNNIVKLPRSTQNKFLAMRTVLAENLSEFLKYAPRKAAIFDWDETGLEEGTSLKDFEYLNKWEDRSMFDMDSVAFLNEKAPLSVLKEAALSPELPDHLKKFLVTAVWTRAYLLGNGPVEREFTPLVSRYATEFAPLFAKYANARRAADREAAALIFILHNPVIQPYVPFGYGRENSEPMTIDSIRGNWWCAEDQANAGYSSYDHYEFAYPAAYPDFLTDEQKQAAKTEQAQMISLGDSATDLARRAVEFANKNPRHRQTPEILHLAVRSTRYGCKDENTGKFSKQAFDLLHSRYRTSPWTRRTPYWFAL